MPSNNESRTAATEPGNGSQATGQAAQPSRWGDLDNEYGAVGEDSPQEKTLPRSGFSWRFVKTGEPPDDPRVRYAMPVFLLWVMLSGLLQGFVQWLVLGFALAVYAVSARAAFQRYGLAGRGWVLAAMGVGQMMLSAYFIMDLGPFWPFIGLYWLIVLAAWAVVELRGLTGLWR